MCFDLSKACISVRKNSFQKLGMQLFFFFLIILTENSEAVNQGNGTSANQREKGSIFVSQSDSQTNKDKGAPGITAFIRARKRATRREEADSIQPYFLSCAKADLSSLIAQEEENKASDTEGRTCVLCLSKHMQTIRQSFYGEVKKSIHSSQHIVFRKKLQEEIVEAIEGKIHQIKTLRACATEDKNLLKQLQIDWESIKTDCPQMATELKSSIKSSWSEMRIQLALSDPAIREDRIRPEISTWLDPTPAHSVPGFVDLQELTQEEKQRARKLYVEALSQTPLERLNPLEFEQRLYKGRPLYFPVAGEKHLTLKDDFQLKKAAKNLQKRARAAYSDIVGENLLLGFLETGNPNNQELGEAFKQIEKKFEESLNRAEDPEVDMDFLLRYEPLVENLLKETPEYCLVAERAKREKDKRKKKYENFELGVIAFAGLTVAAACAIPGIGMPVCTSLSVKIGLFSGIQGYKKTQKSANQSFELVLMGEEFETIKDLETKVRDERISRYAIPLGILGGTAAPARTFARSIERKIRILKKRAAKGIFNSKVLARNKLLGEKSLMRELNPDEVKAIERANLVGFGKPGKNNSLAKKGNYTEDQLSKKNKILREAGFSEEEALKLLEDGIIE